MAEDDAFNVLIAVQRASHRETASEFQDIILCHSFYKVIKI